MIRILTMAMRRCNRRLGEWMNPIKYSIVTPVSGREFWYEIERGEQALAEIAYVENMHTIFSHPPETVDDIEIVRKHLMPENFRLELSDDDGTGVLYGIYRVMHGSHEVLIFACPCWATGGWFKGHEGDPNWYLAMPDLKSSNSGMEWLDEFLIRYEQERDLEPGEPIRLEFDPVQTDDQRFGYRRHVPLMPDESAGLTNSEKIDNSEL